jgi:hypothetical protein
MDPLRRKIRAQLVYNIHAVYIAIVLEYKGRNRQHLLNIIAKDLPSLSGTASGKGRTFLYSNLYVATWRCIISLDFKPYS